MRHAAAFLAALPMLALADAAHAQSSSERARTAVAIACGKPDRPTTLDRSQLAEALLAAYAVPGSEVARALIDRRAREGSTAGTISPEDLTAEAQRLASDPGPLGDKAGAIRNSTGFLADQFARDNSQLKDVLGFSGTQRFSFAPGDGELTCQPAAAPVDKRPAIFAVRGTVEELTEPKKQDATGSLEGSYSRQRVTDSEGERTVTRTFNVRGAVGARIIPDIQGLIAYGDYALSRVRKRTRPTFTPPADDGRGDDIHALEVGLLGTTVAGPLRISGRIGTIFDFENGSRRLKGALQLRPYGPYLIGRPGFALCGVGIYSSNLLGLPLEARCSATVELELSEVLRAGTAQLTDSDELVALGGTIGFEVRPQLVNGEPQDGLVGGILYRYQPMISGNAPDIDRLEATFKHRWWAGDLAVDLGVAYADGVERKSLIDENRISVTLGLLY